MFKNTKAFSGFSVNDLAAAGKFYEETLGIDVDSGPMGMWLNFADGTTVFVYEKPNHAPASFTVLNFPVADINKVVDELTDKGIVFERYEGMEQDEKGIAHGLAHHQGPDIAWFKDPAGNILAVLQQE